MGCQIMKAGRLFTMPYQGVIWKSPRALHQAGGDVKAQGKSGSTPLHQAVLGGHLKVVQWLLGLKIEVLVVDNEEWTPLHFAASRSHQEIAKDLQ